MNDENIALLRNELDKVKQYVPDGIDFTSDWVDNEYKSVVDARDRARQTHRNEYRIIKTLITARTKVLAKNKNNLKLFVPVCKVIKKIEDAIKEEFENEKDAKKVAEEMEKLMAADNDEVVNDEGTSDLSATPQ